MENPGRSTQGASQGKPKHPGKARPRHRGSYKAASLASASAFCTLLGADGGGTALAADGAGRPSGPFRKVLRPRMGSSNIFHLLLGIFVCEAKAFAKEIRRLLKKQRGYILLENEDFMNLFTAWKKNES